MEITTKTPGTEEEAEAEVPEEEEEKEEAEVAEAAEEEEAAIKAARDPMLSGPTTIRLITERDIKLITTSLDGMAKRPEEDSSTDKMLPAGEATRESMATRKATAEADGETTDTREPRPKTRPSMKLKRLLKSSTLTRTLLRKKRRRPSRKLLHPLRKK